MHGPPFLSRIVPADTLFDCTDDFADITHRLTGVAPFVGISARHLETISKWPWGSPEGLPPSGKGSGGCAPRNKHPSGRAGGDKASTFLR